MHDGEREWLTVHPTETLTRDHLEVDSLVSVLGVNHVRELDGVKL